jgi:hypothetical protein
VDETATDSATFLDRRLQGRRSFFRVDRIAAMHRPNPPSIDPGVMAFVWSFLLSLYVYFGLVAVGASAAFAIVITLLGFAAMWLLIRLRGEDSTGA